MRTFRFFNKTTNEIATDISCIDNNQAATYEITNLKGEVLRTVRDVEINFSWTAILDDERDQAFLNSDISEYSKNTWRKIMARGIREEDLPQVQEVQEVQVQESFKIEGKTVTETSTGRTFTCILPHRFVQLATKGGFEYAEYRWNRAQVLQGYGVRQVKEGVVQFKTVKAGNGDAVQVTMQPLELNFGMYTQMLEHDLNLLLSYEAKTDIEKEALAEKIASVTNSLSSTGAQSSLFKAQICGIVLDEQVLSKGDKVKKVYNKSAKTQAKEHIDRTLNLSCAKLRTYNLTAN